MLRLAALLPLICFLAACATPPSTLPTPTAHLNRAEVLDYISAQPAGVTFVSRNGHMYGMDSDAQINLAKNNLTEVTEYGYAVATYKGTYSVDAAGAIHVSLRHYSARWPSMYLRKDRQGAILFPTDQDPSFRLGGRAGGVETSQMARYWPFRQIR